MQILTWTQQERQVQGQVEILEKAMVMVMVMMMMVSWDEEKETWGNQRADRDGDGEDVALNQRSKSLRESRSVHDFRRIMLLHRKRQTQRERERERENLCKPPLNPSDGWDWTSEHLAEVGEGGEMVTRFNVSSSTVGSEAPQNSETTLLAV